MITRTLCLSLAAASMVMAEQAVAPTNAPSAPKNIPIQEMLVIGHSGLKLHSLAMITQGNIDGDVDETYMPGFKACSEDPSIPVRSFAARIMGQNLVADLDKPNPEAVELLIKLARDESSDVRYNAVYHGLAKLKTKPDEVVSLLIDVAAANREINMYDRIAESLKNSREQTTRILDKKMEKETSIALFEIYTDMTGKPFENGKKFMEQPSSRPKVFIFRGGADDAEAYRSELADALKKLGIVNPDLFISGAGANHVLLLKTYITKDRIVVQKAFAKHDKFTITQEMWLTPKLEIELEALRTK